MLTPNTDLSTCVRASCLGGGCNPIPVMIISPLRYSRLTQRFDMKSTHKPTFTASKIASIYALISVVWILFSDQLLAATVTSVETITVMQMAKGWAFVLTTSVLIFFLMRQEMSRFFKADEAQRVSESNFELS